jgi:hydrogenase expression/formation protein HypE
VPSTAWEAACPIHLSPTEERITLAHGEGGRHMHRLITELIVPRLADTELALLGDAASLPRPHADIAFSTDSFVVAPLFFPGGDIGQLAIYGTTNDLAVAGARPLWMSLSFILEEGLPLAVLEHVLDSIAAAAQAVGVRIVAGDTKVVPRGAADGMFINTTGIGGLVTPVPAGATSLEIGDELVVTGPIGRHGVAVLAAREQLGFEPAPTSDCGSLLPAVEALRGASIPLRALRDATRGGVAGVLHEWSQSCHKTLFVEEQRIPVSGEVRGVCELLGLDPLHVANEGTMVVAVAPGAGDAAVDELRRLPQYRDAARVGAVLPAGLASVVIGRGLGNEVPLDEPAGAPMPRIC